MDWEPNWNGLGIRSDWTALGWVGLDWELYGELNWNGLHRKWNENWNEIGDWRLRTGLENELDWAGK